MVTLTSLDRFTEQEQLDLFQALTLSCECAPPKRCGSHEMFLDQRIVNHLHFVRRERQHYIDAEQAAE